MIENLSCVAEVLLEGERKCLLRSLPTHFELAEFKPAHNKKIYEECAKYGIPKMMIEAKRARWLKKSGQS